MFNNKVEIKSFIKKMQKFHLKFIYLFIGKNFNFNI